MFVTCLPSIIALKQPLFLSVVQARVKQIVVSVNLSYDKINVILLYANCGFHETLNNI